MGSSRGYFIGQIVDELGGIANQVALRSKLGDVALNSMLENFFRDVLNLVYDWNLSNLNSKRSNEPGLDLGDAGAKLAFQLTSTATSAKVNKTLNSISEEHLEKYERFFLLVIGNRQGSYTLDEQAMQRVKFNADSIWDITHVLRDAIMLPTLKLQDLHRLIMSETVRIRVELEVPDANGRYPTDIEDFIEQKGVVKRSDATIFANSSLGEEIYGTAEEAALDLDAFADKLSELPRISRGFYAWMLSISEARNSYGGSENYHVNADLLSRLSRYQDTEGEMRFLADRGFIWYDRPEEDHQSAYWRLVFPETKDGFDDTFFEFLSSQKIDVKSVIVPLDFSRFGNPIAL